MAWAIPKFKREIVNRAARIAVTEMPPYAHDSKAFWEWIEASSVVNNWRSAHAYPLNTFQVNLRKSARSIDNTALVAQRTKRLASITAKLERFPDMKLTQMQDIGGCRAIVKSVLAARKLADFYQHASRIKHKLATCDDYIAEPQKSGYRGIHLVYRYVSDKQNTKVYNDLKIEMQIRSQYMHAWATAVETVGTFIRQALKSSIGEVDWLRFFALMGSAIALREQTPPVPDTPLKRSDLIAELDHYTSMLHVENRLQVYGQALQQIKEGAQKNARYYLLRLDPRVPELVIKGFQLNDLQKAEKEYEEAEKYVKSHPETDAVLVAVESIAALEKAYPNYFADTRVFLLLLKQALSGHQRRIFTGNLSLETASSRARSS